MIEVVAVIPVYNEIGALPALVERLRARLPDLHLLIVDDNSPDGTGGWVTKQAAVAEGIELLTRRRRSGLGSATADGIRRAMQLDPRWIATLDGDLSHDPDDLARMIGQVNRPDAEVDVLIGSRYVPGARIECWSRRRRIASRLVNALSRRALGITAVHDVTSALRVYRAETLRRLPWEQMACRHHPWLQQILVHVRRHGARIGEYPVTFRQRSAGRSTLNARSLATNLREWIGLLLRRA